MNLNQIVNENQTPWYEIRNAKDKPPAEEVNILVYGPILSDSFWTEGTVAANFVRNINEITAKKLNVYINSPGGSVYAGKAMYNALKRHKAKKCVFIDSLAASIASIVAMAGDEIYIPPSGTMMAHDPVTAVAGSASDMRKAADLLDAEKKALISIYSERTGLSEDELNALMSAETWMVGQEAVDKGFATALLQTASVQNYFGFDLSGYKNAPLEIINLTKQPPPTPTQEHEMTPEEIQNLVNDQIKKTVEPIQVELKQTKEALATAADTIKNLETENTAAKAKQQAETERQTGINDLFALFDKEPSMYAAHYSKLQAACLSDGSTVADTRKKLIDLRSKFASQPPAKGALNANLDFADEPADVGDFDKLVADKVKESMSIEDAIEWVIENHPQAYKLSLKKANPPKENE